jgi:hypothetical protein
MKNLLLLITLLLATQMLSAQCFPDRHNSSWFDGWLSCATSDNPNPERGQSHWILYNLQHNYQLGQMHVWNTNAEDYLGDGIKDLVIDISLDGVTWTEVGVFQFEQADGSSTYEGFAGPDLDGIEAKYLLITALSNWGGFCYGFSEVRIEVLGVTTGVSETSIANNCLSVNIFPNPVSDRSKASIKANCSSSEINYAVQDITGRTLYSGALQPLGNEVELNLNFADLTAGSYILHLQQDGIKVKQKLIRID